MVERGPHRPAVWAALAQPLHQSKDAEEQQQDEQCHHQVREDSLELGHHLRTPWRSVDVPAAYSLRGPWVQTVSACITRL